MLPKKTFLSLLLVFLVQYSFGQMSSNPAHLLYKIEQKLKSGDKNAFFEIAPYLDSKKELTERFAYNHISAETEAQVALRMIEINSIFTDDEIQINNSLSSQAFLSFLNANLEKITYSELANAFFITPLESRTVKIMFRDITDSKRLVLKEKYREILESIHNTNIHSCINQDNPKVLLLIASELYKERDWLNIIIEDDARKYVELLQRLTNFEISVEGEYKKMVWHIEKDFYPTAALNLLCYFSANYPKFKWNEKKQMFENNEIQILPISKEDDLFQLLKNKKDTIALDAFIQLTTCNPAKVIELANEYEVADIEKNFAIPTFPYRFLKQLVVLTDYCNTNEIDFKGSSHLQAAISKLKSKISFLERRKLEDSLIANLTLDEITVFEYWALIYQKSWGLTYSAGRILDVFYSKNWKKLIENKKYLHCYLKKSDLFNRLGIIGVCNNYLKKFDNSPQDVLTYLENIQTSDEDIKKQAEKIILGKIFDSSKKKSKTFSPTEKHDSEVKDLEKQLQKLTQKVKKSSETDNNISKILSQISYEQIPIALALIENVPFENQWKKYSFMYRDFGFFIMEDFNNSEVRKEFLSLYSKFSEYELYAYFLDKIDIDYKTSGKLDYDKIYELLKYNVVTAFTGGGQQDNEVYMLVKLLELTFDTTLGFPKKLCGANNMYACDSFERSEIWRNYLIENNLLKEQHNEPVSFTYK